MCLKSKVVSGYLLLENETVICGSFFGACKEAHGEVGNFFCVLKWHSLECTFIQYKLTLIC